MKKYVNGMKRNIDEGKSIRKERKEKGVKNVERYIFIDTLRWRWRVAE